MKHQNFFEKGALLISRKIPKNELQFSADVVIKPKMKIKCKL